MKLLMTLVMLLALSGCGSFKRSVANITGAPFVYCYDGVSYLQFPSGAALAVDKNGLPLSCD